MTLDIIQSPSPNFDSRQGYVVDMLVLHYTGMPTGDEALARLCNDASNVSAHYVVQEDGRIHALVPESKRAWHAGVSHWRGETNINQRSIGIEIVNPGHEFGYRAFPKIQMNAVADLCHDILERYPIPSRNIVGHSDIAPSRKEDPGELFDWKWLAAQGIGIYPSNPQIAGEDVGALADYGYDISVPNKAITAFQRHFRPKELTGVWDPECAGLLAALFLML
jgi:N-acetylmuramoyl-L-alanine amidase